MGNPFVFAKLFGDYVFYERLPAFTAKEYLQWEPKNRSDRFDKEIIETINGATYHQKF